MLPVAYVTTCNHLCIGVLKSARLTASTSTGPDEIAEATALYKDTLRGHVQGINFGLLKLVYTKPAGKIIGVHILGEDACELIHYGVFLTLMYMWCAHHGPGASIDVKEGAIETPIL